VQITEGDWNAISADSFQARAKTFISGRTMIISCRTPFTGNLETSGEIRRFAE
jgi:hypothetical protein